MIHNIIANPPTLKPELYSVYCKYNISGWFRHRARLLYGSVSLPYQTYPHFQPKNRTTNYPSNHCPQPILWISLFVNFNYLFYLWVEIYSFHPLSTAVAFLSRAIVSTKAISEGGNEGM